MHDEVKTVESCLQSCAERGYCVLNDETRESLKNHLIAVVDVLYDKYTDKEYPGNNGRFLRAKFMALTLTDILTAKDESEFYGYKNNFKLKFSDLLALYNLCKEDDCKAALVEIKETFAGKWNSMTGDNLFYYRKQISLAENDPNKANDLPKLKKGLEVAELLYSEAEKFIHQQPTLNKRW